ncbi:Amastin surface glycoprotein, putative [Leishmania guyanensis]
MDSDIIVVTTLWGLKAGVFNVEYGLSAAEQWKIAGPPLPFPPCSGIRYHLHLRLRYCVRPRLHHAVLLLLLPLGMRDLNIVGAVTLCLVWTAMVMTYITDEEPFCPEEKRYHTYGSGFVLIVLAWILDLLNIVSLLLPF